MVTQFSNKAGRSYLFDTPILISGQTRSSHDQVTLNKPPGVPDRWFSPQDPPTERDSVIAYHVILDVSQELVTYVARLLAADPGCPAGSRRCSDLTVAREHVLGALYWATSQLDLPTGGYDGAGTDAHAPVEQPAGGQRLGLDNHTRNALLRGLGRTRLRGDGPARPAVLYWPKRCIAISNNSLAGNEIGAIVTSTSNVTVTCDRRIRRFTEASR